MKKRVYFDRIRGNFWPSPEKLRHYFIASPGEEWFYADGNDTAGLKIQGLEGSEGLKPGKGLVTAVLSLWGHPDHGVLIIYEKRGGGYNETFTSKGDMSRLKELVHSLHDTPLPVGLFIPFSEAWEAVKEFMETDGIYLPKSIEWVRNKDLPKNTFPEP